MSDRDNQFREIWIELPDGQSLCALMNGDIGWLMYLRHKDGDAGFSSRNPNYEGDPGAMVDYRLDNGQIDEYPREWALPLATVEKALAFFELNHSPPPFISWHNDSGDGVVIGKGA